MRPLVLAFVIVLALPSLGRAQSLFALRADLRDGRAVHGTLGSAPLEVQRWTGARTAIVRVEDASVAIEGTIDVGREGTQVVVGVGEDAPILANSWRITMSAETWAPLVGRRSERLRIVLPSGLPVRQGSIARPAAPATTVPSRAFVAAPVDWSRWTFANQRLSMRARRDGGPSWTLPAGSLVRSSGERAPYRVDAWVDGFVLHGYSDAPLPISSGGGIAGDLVSGRACVGRARGELRRIPAGTTLRAGSAIAHVRADVTARIAGEQVIAMRSTPGGLAWSFTGVADVDLDSLAVLDALPDDARECWTVGGDWPE